MRFFDLKISLHQIMISNIFVVSCFVILPVCTCLEETSVDYAYHEEKLQLHVPLFNQSCEHEGQCLDHRLTCSVEENTNEKRCLCDKYYSWDIYSKQCLIAENMTEILSQLVEHYDAQAEETEEAQKVFSRMVGAGCMVLVVGLIMAGVCTFIACYRPSKKGDINYDNVGQRRRSSSTRDAPSTSKINTQRAVSPRREGTVDFIPGLFDISAI